MYKPQFRQEQKKITQPSGAATPRDSDAHKRIAVPRLSAFFGSTPDQDPKAAKYAVLIPGPGMFVNVRNAPRVMIPPPSETSRVSPCKPLCAIFLREPSVLPTFACESERGPCVREVKKCDEERFGTTLWRQLFGDICVNSFGEN